MDYLSTVAGEMLSNKPFRITEKDLERLHRENRKDAEECRRVTESSYRGESYYIDDGRPGEGKETDFTAAFFKEVLYRDRKTAGFRMEYPHGLVISQGERNSYYRGENQVFAKSVPSLYRTLERFSSSRDKRLYRFIANMRIAEFGSFLFRIGFVQFWIQNYSDVLVDPLAQHYGLETEWLDITGDFDVAMFFATCKWQDGMWQPLDEEDVRRHPTGVIFHIPHWQAHNTEITSMLGITGVGKDSVLFNTILPIGYQPFMRCHSQYAYGIHMEQPFPLQEDITFEKLHFRHSVKLSQKVYEEMEGGKKIYPQEGLDDFADVIDSIKTAVTFSEEAFDFAYKHRNTTGLSKDVLREQLKNNQILSRPVTITGEEHPYQVTKERMLALEKRYVGFSIPEAYGIQLIDRMVYTPPG